jgi:hypothetical protein
MCYKFIIDLLQFKYKKGVEIITISKPNLIYQGKTNIFFIDQMFIIILLKKLQNI